MGPPEKSRSGFGGKLISGLMILLLFSACAPPAKNDEELGRDLQDLKKEIKVLTEKLDKLQASQQAILDQLQKSAPLPPDLAIRREQVANNPDVPAELRASALTRLVETAHD